MGTIIPSFVIIILVVLFLDTIAENPYVQGALFCGRTETGQGYFDDIVTNKNKNFEGA